MKTSSLVYGTSNLTKIIIAAGLILATFAVSSVNPVKVHAAACTTPATDYGTVDLSVSIPTAGTYRIWTRMSAPSPSSVNNNYLLQLDGTTCYTVGGTTVPVYASGATTYFANDSTNWIAKTTAGAFVDVSFTTGAHALKLIGNADGVVVDRLILTQDTTCTPTGTGDNCANPADTTAPVVSISSPAQSATISTTTTVTAVATDNVAVTKVEFYVDGALKGTDTTAGASNDYTYALNPVGLSVGNHTLTAKAYDAAPNSTTSSAVTVAVPSTIYNKADINTDGVVNFLDFSLLSGKYGQSGTSTTLGRSDINTDGTVNFLDFSTLASNYGKTGP
ncbi:MAG: Ig-like domain-containing protein [Candidatus Saccharimonadales bacterium]